MRAAGCSPRSCVSACHAGMGCSPRRSTSAKVRAVVFQPAMRAAGCSPRSCCFPLAMRAGLQSAQLYFTLPCGQGLQCTQRRFTLLCGQGLQSAQLYFSLPCGHGSQSAHRSLAVRAPLSLLPHARVALPARRRARGGGRRSRLVRSSLLFRLVRERREVAFSRPVRRDAWFSVARAPLTRRARFPPHTLEIMCSTATAGPPDVASFIAANVSPVDGDLESSELSGPTEKTTRLWSACQDALRLEYERGGCLGVDVSTARPSRRTRPGTSSRSDRDDDVVGACSRRTARSRVSDPPSRGGGLSPRRACAERAARLDGKRGKRESSRPARLLESPMCARRTHTRLRLRSVRRGDARARAKPHRHRVTGRVRPSDASWGFARGRRAARRRRARREEKDRVAVPRRSRAEPKQDERPKTNDDSHDATFRLADAFVTDRRAERFEAMARARLRRLLGERAANRKVVPGASRTSGTARR